MDNKIFISIASYRDRLLKNTLLEAYNKAQHKERLVFGVFEQARPEEALNLDDFAFKDQIRYERVDPELSRGVCWARKHVQTMFRDEQYYMQIDAHMLFDNNWDQYYVDHLEEIKKYSAKPIITAYPNNFQHDDLNVRAEYRPNEIVMIWTGEERSPEFKEKGFCPPWGGYFPSKHSAVHGFYIGACFIFTIGSFVRDVPYDDSIFFGGEEPALSLRAWTHGYDIFHIQKLHLYHCWHKSYGGVIHWDVDGSKSQQYKSDAKVHLEKLINNQVPAPYGLGTERTLEQYMAFSGLNYIIKEYKHNPKMFTVPYYEKINYDVG